MACDRRTALLACINLPAFPLQLQFNEQPQWHRHPCAVIDCDKPQGTLLWVNDLARRRRILPGMRYAAALSLDCNLRAAEVSQAHIDQAVERLIAEALTDFSPRVEASADEPGVFWLDLAGMDRLYPDLESWAENLVQRLDDEGFVGRVVVGWSRFHCYALAVGAGDELWAGGRTILLCHSPDHERRLAAKVPLRHLGLDPDVREALDDLGVTTLGEFTALPGEGIERRFGRQVAHLHEQACGQRQPPLEAEEIEDEVSERVFIEESIRDLRRLMLWIESLLISCLTTLAGRGELASHLRLELSLENGDTTQENLRPAEPTNDAEQWLDLLGLRLDDMRLGEGAQEIALTLAGKRVPPGQTELFSVQPRRDLAAANRALARVRAELGDAAVRRAEIRDGHLPEAQFAWRTFKRLDGAQPSRIAETKLIRRLFSRPKRLPPRPRQEPDGWLPRGVTDSPVDKVHGPFIVAGGWWRSPIQREYHYAETRTGEVLWTYYDRLRRRWYLQGRLE